MQPLVRSCICLSRSPSPSAVSVPDVLRKSLLPIHPSWGTLIAWLKHSGNFKDFFYIRYRGPSVPVTGTFDWTFLRPARSTKLPFTQHWGDTQYYHSNLSFYFNKSAYCNVNLKKPVKLHYPTLCNRDWRCVIQRSRLLIFLGRRIKIHLGFRINEQIRIAFDESPQILASVLGREESLRHGLLCN